jgi:hypothetical protein
MRTLHLQSVTTLSGFEEAYDFFEAFITNDMESAIANFELVNNPDDEEYIDYVDWLMENELFSEVDEGEYLEQYEKEKSEFEDEGLKVMWAKMKEITGEHVTNYPPLFFSELNTFCFPCSFVRGEYVFGVTLFDPYADHEKAHTIAGYCLANPISGTNELDILFMQGTCSRIFYLMF